MGWIDGYAAWTTKGPAWRLVAGIALAVFLLSAAFTAYLTSDRAGSLQAVEEVFEDDLPVESESAEAESPSSPPEQDRRSVPGLPAIFAAVIGIYAVLFLYEALPALRRR
jgi:hypothetical protein